MKRMHKFDTITVKGGKEAWSWSGDPGVETDSRRRGLFLVKLIKFDNYIDHATVAYSEKTERNPNEKANDASSEDRFSG